LQHKPALPTPNFEAGDDTGVALSGSGGKVVDPFAPPYNTNLHVGELKDEGSEEEFVVFVRPVTGLSLALFLYIHG
jgi:ATP adenylyltransferase